MEPEKIYTKEDVQKIMYEVLERHAWMKDGVSYVGSGIYTLKKAKELMEADYYPIFKV